MIFTETELSGAYIIDLEQRRDQRGFFARMFCVQEFEAHGLNSSVAQCSLSFNHKQGTLRGMHYQVAPAAESKVVRCIRGAIHDVIIDLRPDSKTFKSYTSVELTAENHRSLYIPEGFAHGFQTLTDQVEVLYQMSEFYEPDCQRGLLYSDPTFDIAWPLPINSISEKDATLPLFES